MRDAYQILLAHVALPDSLKERKLVLQAFSIVMTPEHPAFKTICAQINAIEKLETLQKDLPLKFAAAAKPATERDGR